VPDIAAPSRAAQGSCGFFISVAFQGKEKKDF
jgi:hypothetical protein